MTVKSAPPLRCCRKCGYRMKWVSKTVAECPNGCDQCTARPEGELFSSRTSDGGFANNYRTPDNIRDGEDA